MIHMGFIQRPDTILYTVSIIVILVGMMLMMLAIRKV